MSSESERADVQVIPVSGRRDLKAFIDLPFKLHANHPLWVPLPKLERWVFLNRRLNAFFSHGEAEYFLARRGGRLVGRITAQVNHAFNDYQQKNWGWYGFLEFEDDQEVLDSLLAAAEAWCRARGKERMVGPADFSMNEESGILIEGYELRPMIKQPWHPPYYQQRMEQAGMSKAMDLLMWNLEVTDRDKVLPVIWELAGKVQSEHGIRVRPMRRRQLRKDMDAFAEVYNAAWSKNWDFVPYSKKDLDAYAQEIQLVFDKHWCMIAEREDTGEVVGMAMTFPDINQVLEKMERQIPAARLVAFPAQGPHHRPGARRVPGRQAGVSAHGRGGEAVSDALRRGRSPATEGRGDGLDPRDEHGDEPRHGSDGREGRQAVPGVRAGVVEVPSPRGGRPGESDRGKTRP